MAAAAAAHPAAGQHVNMALVPCARSVRCGCWFLSANGNQHLPRNESAVTAAIRALEDERHILLECEAYADIREGTWQYATDRE